jgi:ankyrin repeat protein
MPHDTFDTFSIPSLHRAAETGNTKLVDLLLKSGASPSVVDNEVINPSAKLQKYVNKQFICHGYIGNHFSSEMFIKLTFSDSVESHD